MSFATTTRKHIPFYPSYKEVDYRPFIAESTQEIVAVAYYCDQWITTYKEELLHFFRKSNSHFRLILADESVPQVFTEIQRLFPEHSAEALKLKIIRTKIEITNLHQEVRNPSSRLSITQVAHPLTYACQCFDQKKLFYSIYETCRDTHIPGPAFMIDLETNPEARPFYQKEIHELTKQ